MRSTYLCPGHVKLVAENLQAAKHDWHSFVSRGESAYSNCRWDVAEIYLNAAIDVAMVRMLNSKSKGFSFFHILKPSHLLYEIYVAESNFKKSREVIGKARKIISETTNEEFADGLLKSFERILPECDNGLGETENLKTVH